MIIGKINDKTEIDDCVLRETSVSEEQVLFNKLNWENQQMILRIMRCLQPCEIIEKDKKIEKICTNRIINTKDILEFEMIQNKINGEYTYKINELIDEVNKLKEKE